MELQKVSFKTAKLLTELEIAQEPTDEIWLSFAASHCAKGERKLNILIDWMEEQNIRSYEAKYYAPTQALVQKILREKYRIDCTPVFVDFNCYDSSIYSKLVKDEEIEEINEDNTLSYEEALEEGIYESLLLIKRERKNEAR